MLQADIHKQLTQKKACADALLQLLDQESTAIIRGDVDELGQLTKNKKQRVDELGELGPQMQQWLKQRSLDEWLQRQSAPVQSSWQQLSESLKLCRRKNDANGLLIDQRQQEIEQRLRPMEAGTYGQQGENQTQQGNSLSFTA